MQQWADFQRIHACIHVQSHKRGESHVWLAEFEATSGSVHNTHTSLSSDFYKKRRATKMVPCYTHAFHTPQLVQLMQKHIM